MELPKAPQDIELRNIIDKLAQFVARNGPEFEQMTKNKQKGNPKFSFLFGGEYFNYYQYKVTTEQAILKLKEKPHETSNPAGGGGLGGGAGLGGGGVPTSTASSALSALLINAVQGISNMNNVSNQGGAVNLLSQWLGGGGGGHPPPPLPPPLPPPPHAPTSSSSAPSTPATIESLIREQAALQEQTQQSQANLNAQHLVLIQQQEQQVEDAIRSAEGQSLEREAEELGVNLTELNTILQPIIETCTKDSISNGKAWILQRATSSPVNSLLAKYLLYKVLEPEKSFNHKLHIIYLVNDILHHCVRKHTEEFKVALEQVVVPMFCNASLGVTDEQQAKLNKLMTIWETKNHYFSDEIVAQLHEPVVSWAKYKSERANRHREIVERFSNETKAAFSNFQSQHLAFVSHTVRQIQTLEQQRQQLEVVAKQQAQLQAQLQAVAAVAAAAQQQQQQQQQAPPPLLSAPAPASAPPPPPPPPFPSSAPSSADQPGRDEELRGGSGEGGEGGSSGWPGAESSSAPPSGGDFKASGGGPLPTALPPHHPPPPAGELGINITQPPPGFLFQQPPPPAIELPDLTRPPPGFPLQPPEVQPEDLLPSLPYFDLPAGLMVPLIKLEDCKYKPLDPEAIRLPPPAPPSERLLAAVKAFYTPPGHDQPRDSDGWEKLGLYEYFRAKIAARRKKEEDIERGLRDRSRSPTPVRSWHEAAKSPPPKRRYSSRSRSRSRERGESGGGGRGGAESGGGGGGGRSGGGGGGKSRRGRRGERSPPHHRNSSNSPPPFMGIGFGGGGGEPGEERLTEGNKGHQMLKKMGWGGAGLGAKEQGIETPIHGGDVRDRSDQYKGVGLNLNDPYENFRKSKGQAFITRMKARAEERS